MINHVSISISYHLSESLDHSPKSDLVNTLTGSKENSNLLSNLTKKINAISLVNTISVAEFSEQVKAGVEQEFASSLADKGFSLTDLSSECAEATACHQENYVRIMTEIFAKGKEAHLSEKEISEKIIARKIQWMKNEEPAFYQQIKHLFPVPIFKGSQSGAKQALALHAQKQDQQAQKMLYAQKLKSKLKDKSTFNTLEIFENFADHISQLLFSIEEGTYQSIKDSKESAALKANRIMQELIDEEENEKTRKAKKTKNSSIKKSQKNNSVVVQPEAKSAPILKSEIKNKLPAVTINQKNKTTYLLELHQQKNPFQEHARVTRWRTKTLTEIQHFVDKDSMGTQIYRYQNYSDKEISQQRAQHYLPEIEKLLINPTNQKVYSFKTDRGYGMMAELCIDDQVKYGIIYLGMGIEEGKKEVIFHKYFEEVDLKDLSLNPTSIFTDKNAVKLDKTISEIRDEDQEWKKTTSCTFDINAKGIMTLKYEGEEHFVRIHPVRKDLLKDLFK